MQKAENNSTELCVMERGLCKLLVALVLVTSALSDGEIFRRQSSVKESGIEWGLWNCEAVSTHVTWFRCRRCRAS